MTGRSTRRRHLGALAAMALVATSLSVVSAIGGSAAPIASAAAPASKRVYVVTDSVGLGAKNWFPGAFPSGWEVILDGDAGEFTETMARKYAAPRAAAGQLGDYAVVATGYNYPFWDPQRFDNSIDEMIATLTAGGVKHVLWVTLREVKPQYVTASAWRQVQPYYWYFPTVNDHLEAALQRHPNLTLVDWAAVADQPGLTYDAIHLNPTGAALYTSIVRQAVEDVTTAVAAGSVTHVAIPDREGVEAVALNLTTVSPRDAGFLTAFACDQPQPESSSHNYRRGETVAHSVVVDVSDSGEVCIATRSTTNLLVDITGRFGPAASASPNSTGRLLDTRTGNAPLAAGAPRQLPLGGTDDAIDVLSVTAVDATQPGFVQLAPCGSTAVTSTVNVTDKAPVPNMAIVVDAPDTPQCLTASMTTHVIVDRFASFGADTEFDIGEPRRVLDTREASSRPAAGSTLTLDADALGSDADVTGVILNLTATDAGAGGFLSAFPCAGGTPATSSLNHQANGVIANLVIVPPDTDGDVCIFTLASTHVVVDLLGTIGANFTGGTPQRLLDTRQARPDGWP